MTYLQLFKTYPRYLGFGFLHTFFSSIGQTYLIALFIPHLRTEFNQSTTAMGSYYGLVTVASAITLFVTGPWIDRINLRKYSISVGFLVMTGCLTLYFSNHLFVAVLGLYMIRHGGQALMTHTAFTTMARYFTMARGKALAITGLGISTAMGILPWTFTKIIATLEWRNTYLLLAGCCVFVFAPLSLFLVNKSDDLQNPQTSQQTTSTELYEHHLNWGRKEMLSHSYYWTIFPFLVLPPIIGTGIFFFQAEIAASKSWEHVHFTKTFLIYSLAAAISSFLSGPWIDRFTGTRLLPFSQIPMVLGLCAWLTLPGVWSGYLFMMLMGMSMGTIGNILNAMWAEVYGRQKLGSIKSFVTMVAVFATALAPAIGGWLLDRSYSMQSILWTCVWISLIGSMITFFAKPPKRDILTAA